MKNNNMGQINTDETSKASNNYIIDIFDDKGNEYIYPYMTFRDQKSEYGNLSSFFGTKFPEGPECKGSITLKNVPSDVKSVTYTIGVYVYNGVRLDGDKISFKNVPVFK